MPLAKRCECEQPLIIEEPDWCSFCSRLTIAVNPPRVEDEYTPIELAVQMYKAGTSMRSIMAETGLGDLSILRAANPDEYERVIELRRQSSVDREGGSRYERRALAKRAKQEAFDSAFDKYEAIRTAAPLGVRTKDRLVALGEISGQFSIVREAKITGLSQGAVRAIRKAGSVDAAIQKIEARERRESLAAKKKANRERDAARFSELMDEYAHMRVPRAAGSQTRDMAVWQRAAVLLAAEETEDGKRQWTNVQIAAVLGVNKTTVALYIDPEFRARRNECARAHRPSRAHTNAYRAANREKKNAQARAYRMRVKTKHAA